ncbi:GP44 [Caviid betaherpesvirus 2]|uniref:DNA polymerase processivity factor n=2 Tax=Caviid betaherpesvirus 2 TaxID=33706 RepID=U6H9U4_9BETA|nr:GP44 [Caviid betaherpesvirus 2]AGE11521.1 GP44 [Caviid betaherpesvirus 2]AIL83909.1 GP44 [BAC cloning vector GPN13BACdenovo_preserved(MM)]BAJ78511.1 GP44 [Caviid betaherpesvirus 2]CDI95387.1 GP44 [Caviid herpesvirus 2 str. CIDMTR]
MERKTSQREPVTLALRLRPYKAATQQLRSIIRGLKENTTITFLETPAMVVQTARANHVSKITFNSSCLYISDRNEFQRKTINNQVPLVGSFMHLSSNKDLTKLYIQDLSPMYAHISMVATDFNMEFSSACVHNQDVVRENGESFVRADLSHSVVTELIRWVAPYTRAKRTNKKQSAPANTVQMLVHANPPTLKLIICGSGANNELEFVANEHVSFHDVKPVHLMLNTKNFHNALTQCAVTKLSCAIRVLSDHDNIVHLQSKNNSFTVESFVTEEPYSRDIERPLPVSTASAGHRPSQANSIGSGANAVDGVAEDGLSDQTSSVGKKSHGSKKAPSGQDHDQQHGSSQRDKYDQHKITNYMTQKGISGGGSERGGGSGYFGDAKEESDSDESLTFDFVSNVKKQKCSA